MGFSSFSRTSLVMDSKQDCNRPRSAQDLASRMETSSRSAACIVCVGGGTKCQAWLHWGSRRPTSAQNRVGRPQQVSKNANNDVIMEMSQVASCC